MLGLAVPLGCKHAAATPIEGPACALAPAQWPAADALFRRDPAWLGADAAYSVDLGGSRVLWRFGDSFIAKSPARSRSDAWFIRNSVAVQSASLDPSSAAAQIAFAWRTSNGAATSFFPERGGHWFWPLSGVRLPSRLVLFMLEEVATGSGSFGFQSVGTKVAFVKNADMDPSAWTLEDGTLPVLTLPIALGAAVVRDGDSVYLFGVREPGDHSVYLARISVTALDAGELRPRQRVRGADRVTCSCPPTARSPT